LTLVREHESDRDAFSYWPPEAETWIDASKSAPWLALRWAMAGIAPTGNDTARHRKTLERARKWFNQTLGLPLIAGGLSDLRVELEPRFLFVTCVSRRRS